MATKAGITAGKAFVVIEAIDGTASVLRSIQGKIMRWAAGIQSLGQRLFMRALATSLPSVISTKMFKDFDDAMRRVEARASGTAAQMESLRKQAKDLGTTGAFSATQIANLMDKLGTRGFNREQIMQMTPHVMNVGRAAGEGDLGKDVLDAADAVSSAINTFQLGAQDAQMVGDMLTQAANASKFSLEDLQIALATAGPVARDFNANLAETLAILSVMRDVGIDASVAGTGLRNMYLKAADSTARDRFNKELEDLTGNTISFVDAVTGDLATVPDILNSLDQAMQGLGTGQRGDLLRELFGLRAITPASAAMADMKTFTRHLEGIVNSKGLGGMQAGQMEQGIGGALRNILRFGESAALVIGQKFEPAIVGLGNAIKNNTQAILDWIDAHASLIIKINLGIIAALALGASLFIIGASLQIVGTALTPVIMLIGAISSLTWVASFSLIVFTKAIYAAAAAMFAFVFNATTLWVLAGIPRILVDIAIGGWALIQPLMVAVGMIPSAIALIRRLLPLIADAVVSLSVTIGVWVGRTVASLLGLSVQVAASIAGTTASIITWGAAFLGVAAPIAVVAAIVWSLYQMFQGESSKATTKIRETASVWSGVWNTILGIWGKLKSVAVGVFDFIAQRAKLLGHTVKLTFQTIAEALRTGDIDLAWDALMVGLQATWAQTVDFFMIAWTKIIGNLKLAWLGFLSFIAKGNSKLARMADLVPGPFGDRTAGERAMNWEADIALGLIRLKKELKSAQADQSSRLFGVSGDLDLLRRWRDMLSGRSSAPGGVMGTLGKWFGFDRSGFQDLRSSAVSLRSPSAIDGLQQGTIEAAKQFYENMRNFEKAKSDKLNKALEDANEHLSRIERNTDNLSGGASGDNITIVNV